MSTANSTLQIPQEVLQPIIDAHVAAAIATALGDRSRMIQEAVTAALNVKVDERDGKPSNYSTNVTFLQWLVRSSIRDAATQAVREHLALQMDEMKKLVAKEMKNQRSPLTKALIEGVAKAAAESTRFNIRVSVDGVEQR